MAPTLATAVLVMLLISHPTNFGDKAQRVLYTFAGVGIAIIVMLLSDQLQKRSAKATPQPQAT